MQRGEAIHYSPEIMKLFDGYVHGQVSKREFLERAGKVLAAGVSAAVVLESLEPNYALASQVAEDDPEIETEWVTYASPEGHGTIKAYMARPAGASGKLPAVLVVHENRGLNPYIQDVVRRAAKAGFLAMGPDGLSALGGYPGNDNDGREMQKQLDRTKLLNDFFAAFEHLRDHADSTGKVGAVGFCYGGGVCNQLAVKFPEMAASVPIYGRQAAAEDVPKIQAPLQLHYGETDERINAGWPAYEAALEANGKAYTAHFYEGVGHAFHNDTTPRYNEAAAKLAWERTVAFFKEHLG